MTLDRVLQLEALGFSIIPVKARGKDADGAWLRYQQTRATVDELRAWFGNGAVRNAGVVTGAVSGVIVVDTDSLEAENWCAAHLPPTPMMTRTARGRHRYYLRPPMPEIPAHIERDGLAIEIRRDGHYVLAPGSVHPDGSVYAEVEPWPPTLETLPFFPLDFLHNGDRTNRAVNPEPLPEVVPSGERNARLYREGCRLRRLGYDREEIARTLLILNGSRCDPPLAEREVEGIAASCANHAPAVDTFPLTEAGDAEYFASCFGEQARFDHRRARWLLFNGHHWMSETDGEVDRLSLDAVRGRQAAATTETDTARRAARLKWATGGEARKRQANLLALARSVRPIADDGENWDSDPWLLGVANGVVDLQTGRLRTGRPSDRITRVSPVAFDPSASGDSWSRFVLDVCDGDTDLAAYLQVSFGYVLTGLTSEQCFWIFYGLGANGKSTFLETLTRHVLPEHSWSMPFPSNAWSESISEYQRAELVGRRLVVAKENEQAKRLNTEFIKSLTGDETIAARHPYCRPFNFRPTAKFFLAVNHLPVIRDESHGMWRRVRLVPFNRQFATDPAFAQRLVADAPGILTWAVRGAAEYRRNGLITPSSVLVATQKYREESDVLAKFFEDRCCLGADRRAQAQPLFEEYRHWCDARREADSDRLSQKEFAARLEARFTAKVIDRKKFYMGIGIREGAQADLEM